MDKLKRINKYISETGFCSRREADKLILDGRVSVNGKKAEMGQKIEDSDKVSIDKKLVGNKAKRIFLAFNKPVGITCTTDSRDKDNIIDFIDFPERIFTVGRLDKMSGGLIFLTNDGDIVNKILRPGNNHEKVYLVRVRERVTDEFISKMSNGIKILETTTKKCKVSKKGNHSFYITLTQGLNRQIRRMCEALGFKVTKLMRIKIMNIELGQLKPGEYRDLNEREIATIDKLVIGNKGTQENKNSNQ